MRIIFSINNIDYSSNCRFIGSTKIKTHKSGTSSILIGEECTFRSKATSNLIGLNHKCIIATHASRAVIEVGNKCGFSGTTLGAFKHIKIGNNVMCGANTLITDSDWHPKDPRSGEPRSINIEDNVWLGTGVMVLKGVTIGANSVVGAGSVVTKNIPSNVIAAGNPCRVIKHLSPDINSN